MSDPWRDLVVVVATNNWDVTKLHDRHMAERLAAHAPVLYVDPPLSHRAAHASVELRASLDRPRLRVLGPTLARLTPVVPPFPMRPAMLPVTERLVRHVLGRAVATLTKQPAAVLSGAPMVDLAGVCGERRFVYWAQDDYAALAGHGGPSVARVRAAEARRAAAADLVVAANPDVQERFRAMGHEVALVPYGCDTLLFAAVDDAPLPLDVDLSPPVAGFVGHLNFRTDASLLAAVADRDLSLLLVGPRSTDLELDRLLARPNVRWVGPKRFSDLPSYERMIDVGLVPYNRSAFNKGSFPLKTLEYLAAGRPVVSTDLPATRWLGTPLVTVADEPETFADAVERWARQPRSLAAMNERRSFAAKHSWEIRAADMARLLGIGVAS